MIYLRNAMTLCQNLLFPRARETAHRLSRSPFHVQPVLEFYSQCSNTLGFQFSGWFEFIQDQVLQCFHCNLSSHKYIHFFFFFLAQGETLWMLGLARELRFSLGFWYYDLQLVVLSFPQFCSGKLELPRMAFICSSCLTHQCFVLLNVCHPFPIVCPSK